MNFVSEVACPLPYMLSDAVLPVHAYAQHQGNQEVHNEFNSNLAVAAGFSCIDL